MELFPLSLPILLTFFLFMIMVFKLGKKNKSYPSTLNLPPGPWRLPIIGNIHQLASSVPHRALLNLAKKHGPLMHLKLGEVHMIVVSSSEVAKEFLKTHDITFATRPEIHASRIIGYGNKSITFSPYGNYWRQCRKICMLELMSLKRVQSFRPIRDEEKNNFIKWISSNAGSAINLTEKVFSTSYTITSKAAFGKKQKEQEQFEEVVKQLIKAAEGFDLSDLFPSNKLLYVLSGMRTRLQRIHKGADRILGNIVAEHRSRHLATKTGGKEVDEEDFVDVLLKYEENGSQEIHLTTDNIKAVLLDIFAGGSETSATTADWAMSEMTKNPRVMEKAQAEVRKVFEKQGFISETGFSQLDYLKLVIKETLRLHPPVPLLLPRETRENCKINGYDIPFKSRVLINAWAIGRDPNQWTDADIFYPERFLESSIDFKGTDFEYIPFGAGRRICPGMSFGLASTELLLALLLYHFDWKLPAGAKHQDLDMTDTTGITSRRNDDLFLIPTPYQPSVLESSNEKADKLFVS